MNHPVGILTCNKEHVAIIYGSQPCPLCASHEEIKKLEAKVRRLQNSINVLIGPTSEHEGGGG